MKVSTDACIQGAWTPVPDGTTRILDIGAGTGLLSLMLAQRSANAHIVAIESDAGAAMQAAANFSASPFANRLLLAFQDATQWIGDAPYDLIICNPPFFRNNLKGPDEVRNAARHAALLHPSSLCALFRKHLAESGTASVMWPEAEHGIFIAEAAKARLHMHRSLLIRDRAGTRINRIISTWARHRAIAVNAETLIIKEASGDYTPDFKRLLSPFYLYL